MPVDPPEERTSPSQRRTVANFTSDCMDSLRRHRGSTLLLRLLEVCLAPQAVGLLVTLLTAVVTPRFLGVRGLAVPTPFSLFALPFSLWSLDFPLPWPLKRKASTSMGTEFTVMNFARAISVTSSRNFSHRGVQHHVPAQGFLLDAGLHKNGDGEAGLLLKAPDVPLPRLDVVQGAPLEPAVQDAQQCAGEAAPGLRLPLLLKATPCSQALTLAGRLHLVQRPVLRQERHPRRRSAHRRSFPPPSPAACGCPGAPPVPARVLAVELVWLSQDPRDELLKELELTPA